MCIHHIIMILMVISLSHNIELSRVTVTMVATLWDNGNILSYSLTPSVVPCSLFQTCVKNKTTKVHKWIIGWSNHFCVYKCILNRKTHALFKWSVSSVNVRKTNKLWYRSKYQTILNSCYSRYVLMWKAYLSKGS